MIKFIKEIFSSDNLKKAMIYSSLSDPNITTSDYSHLNKLIKQMDIK